MKNIRNQKHSGFRVTLAEKNYLRTYTSSQVQAVAGIPSYDGSVRMCSAYVIDLSPRDYSAGMKLIFLITFPCLYIMSQQH